MSHPPLALPPFNATVPYCTPTQVAEQLAGAVGQTASSPLLYLLPPCLALLAVDIAIRLAPPRPSFGAQPSPKGALIASSQHDERLRRLSDQAQQVWSHVEELEKRLADDNTEAQRKHRNFGRHRQHLEAHHLRRSESPASIPLPPSPSPPSPLAAGNPRARKRRKKNADGVTASFTTFCDKLVLQNRIWKQEKEIKALQQSIETAKSKSSSDAIKVFWDHVLLSNNIWKSKKEIKRLEGEVERLRQGEEKAMTKEAQRVAREVEKDRLVEQFVKDLISEVGETRKVVDAARNEHEKEMLEFTEEWRKDCRRLAKEVDRLQLAQDARLMEQHLSNQVETELVEQLSARREEKAKARDIISPFNLELLAEEEEELLTDDGGATLSDCDFDRLSMLSTSTCISTTSLASPRPRLTLTSDSTKLARRRTMSHIPSSPALRRTSSSFSLRSISSLPRTSTGKIDTSSYMGFSFNSQFFRTAGSSDTSSTLDPASTRRRTVSLSSETFAQKRRAWR